ncbi:hypothetical protein Aau02nite_86830 [Amorphoplanes auranticolor]|uniref:Uncharacterized protein n=2 Tax=Actinoplanes auranticolor TaxID=47988 RepID=A0A919SX79_9ACTN|nr:hypothetical protein Aau02nite_86830 [Actinoplanes auranticolor]
MFATMRRKNRSAKMKSELGQSVDHFKRAASLAAQETSATVGPRFYAARDRVQPTASKAKDAASSSWGSAVATLTPLVTAATDKAQRVSKSTATASKKDLKASKKDAMKIQKRANKALKGKESSKSSKLGGLLLAGAAVGAAGAYVLRKRRQEQWDEYDPSPVTTRITGSDEALAKPADLSGPSGFVTPKGETGPVVGAVGSDPAGGAGVDPTVGAGTTEPAIELVDADPVDQTQSAQHSEKVARLASGGQKKN